jgi:prepilin-type N-terminal cleavage/methylation domain-containing protein
VLDKLKDKKGFTLIEIVLVLAIAGLIMVIVFLAVSGAQRSRRDTQRKEDLSRIAAQIESYASNTNGCYPGSAAAPGCAAATTWAAFSTSNYITGSNLNDPLSGQPYTYTGLVQPTTTVPAGVQYIWQQDCTGAAAGARVYRVTMQLEQGTVCRDNR